MSGVGRRRQAIHRSRASRRRRRAAERLHGVSARRVSAAVPRRVPRRPCPARQPPRRPGPAPLVSRRLHPQHVIRHQTPVRCVTFTWGTVCADRGPWHAPLALEDAPRRPRRRRTRTHGGRIAHVSWPGRPVSARDPACEAQRPAYRSPHDRCAGSGARRGPRDRWWVQGRGSRLGSPPQAAWSPDAAPAQSPRLLPTRSRLARPSVSAPLLVRGPQRRRDRT